MGFFKSQVRKLISSAVQNDVIWRLLDRTLFPLVDFAKFARKSRGDIDFVQRAIKESFPDFVVLHGPFKGMKYFEIKSFYSIPFPKLLGSYEKEIHSIIEALCHNQYRQIVDIGCAEGYYAVGFAYRIPTAAVYAFDTNGRARQLCQELAKHNGVAERVHIDAYCSQSGLAKLLGPDRALIVCDIDGYEASLFDASIVPIVARHDLLIETHDYLDIEISSKLRRLFESSHDITTIDSVDDIRKVQEYCYPELGRYSSRERQLLIGEFRPAIQQWLWLTPKPLNVAG